MISVSHKTIFVHIPKCAGQSVEETFLKDISPDLTWEAHRHILSCFQRPDEWDKRFPQRLAHLSADEYTSLSFVSRHLWEEYYKFSIVREPVDRCVSMWRFLPDASETFDEFVFDFLPKKISSGDFWFKSQAKYVLDPKTKEELVNDIIPFRALSERWNQVKSRSCVNADLLHRNKTSNNVYPELTQQVQIRIRELYSDDYDLLSAYF